MAGYRKGARTRGKVPQRGQPPLGRTGGKSPTGKPRIGRPPAGKSSAGMGGRSQPLRSPRSAKSRAPIRVTPLPSSTAGPGAGALVDNKVRLNRYLAAAGICSRRAADALITSGRVSVNGQVVRELGVKVDPGEDTVRYDGVKVTRERPTYVLFNKPKEVLCTNATNEPRKRVIDYLPEVRGRLYTVGRLDAESEGLIILTNDGDFTQKLTHPRYGVPKTYAVLIRGRLTSEHKDKARGGVWLSEGRTGEMKIVVERLGAERTYLKCTIREGKNRELRRIFARLGYAVISLKRVRIGDLTLHGLKVGAYRFLHPEEVQGLLAAATAEVSPV